MSFGGFLRDRLPTLCAAVLTAAFAYAMLTALGAGGYAGGYLAGAILLAQALALGLEYVQRRRFYGTVAREMEKLDRKYLIAELMPVPSFEEGKLFCELTRAADKSMCDAVAEARRQSREYREYIETWVHEIKTPISTARLTLENSPGESTRDLSRSLTSIENYVEQALYYSRSGSVERDYLIRETTLQALAASALKKNAALLIEAGASVHTQGLERTAFTDAKWTDFMLGQVLMNAVKYRSGPLEITITGAEEENGVTLTVSDNGIGIPPGDLPHIFEKGFTGQNGRQGAKSTGLGLYLCRKLCDKMGLGLSADSRPGEGTRVTFTFPAGGPQCLDA